METVLLTVEDSEDVLNSFNSDIYPCFFTAGRTTEKTKSERESSKAGSKCYCQREDKKKCIVNRIINSSKDTITARK